MRLLFEGGDYSRAASIRRNTVYAHMQTGTRTHNLRIYKPGISAGPDEAGTFTRAYSCIDYDT